MQQQHALVERHLKQALEIIPGQFGFLCGPTVTFEEVQAACGANHIVYCIDEELEYEPFYGDFGPLNMAHTYRFCTRTASLMQAGVEQDKMVYLYTAPHAWRRANAAALVGIFEVLFLNMTPAEAYSRLAPCEPYTPFRDASTGESMLPLSVLDVIEGMHAAEKAGFLPWTHDPAAFDLDAYEHYEQVQNGDLNWIVPGKLLAFAGPTAAAKVLWGYRTFTPEDYWGYFQETGISAVIRLNNKLYEGKAFQDGGFQHYDLYFPDGSCPTNEIVLKFLEICERESGGVAIHCKAGLGRTGVLICCYIMKHYGLTARQAIAYIRICRPGSVIGPQQTFLAINERELWRHGEAFRSSQKAKAADWPKQQPCTKKRNVIDITASASGLRLPAVPGPLPGATASPLQDAKGGRWLNGTSLGDRSLRCDPPAGSGGHESCGPLITSASADAEAAAPQPAAPLPPPLPSAPATRSSGGFRAALRDIISGGPRTRSSSAMSGSGNGDSTPPASPSRPSMVPAVAKASPHYMASNGQPRKGAKIIAGTGAKGTSKVARGLDFGSSRCGKAAAEDAWSIGTSDKSASCI